MRKAPPNKSARGAKPGLAGGAKAHIFPVRVYYEDTDAGGIVYYANYLRFAERARTEMLRRLGIESSKLMAEAGVAFAVRRCAADFRRPARLDDTLEVQTRLIELGGASLELEQRIVQAGSGSEVVDLVLTLACMTATGKPARIPPAIRRRLT